MNGIHIRGIGEIMNLRGERLKTIEQLLEDGCELGKSKITSAWLDEKSHKWIIPYFFSHNKSQLMCLTDKDDCMCLAGVIQYRIWEPYKEHTPHECWMIFSKKHGKPVTNCYWLYQSAKEDLDVWPDQENWYIGKMREVREE